MIKKIFIYSIIAALTLYCVLDINKAKADEIAFLNIDEIMKNIDPAKFTKAQIKEYHKNITGKQAKGEGVVVNVLPGKRDRHRVTILTPASKPEKGYNVVLYTTMDAPSDLHLNDRILFEGEVGRLSTFRGASVDIHGSYKKIGTEK
ncbi:MAG: hypothetical protein AB1610_02855 [Nitrospirota bacterium]